MVLHWKVSINRSEVFLDALFACSFGFALDLETATTHIELLPTAGISPIVLMRQLDPLLVRVFLR